MNLHFLSYMIQLKKIMKREQLIKILKVALISTAILLVAEGIFDIPAVTNWFSGLISGNTGIVAWIIIWVIMFLQVTILNIPAFAILNACGKVEGIETLSAAYFFVVLSAYMCGCLLAYWLGYKFGKKAIKWCAGSEEDYLKWSRFINKKGKIWYFLTVLFPFFPDDILCIVAGSVKFNFWWYTIFNFFGRGIGLITTILFLKFVYNIGGGFPIMLVVWFALLIAEIIIYRVLVSRQKREMLNKKQSKQMKEIKANYVEIIKPEENEQKIAEQVNKPKFIQNIIKSINEYKNEVKQIKYSYSDKNKKNKK